MKRSIPVDPNDQKTMKKIKQSENTPPPPSPSSYSAVAEVFSDENLLYEILSHVDAKMLGAAACVSKHWNRTAQDERLWELICTENIGCGKDQLRTVVRALGGFRCLHSRYLLPLSKPSLSTKTTSSSSSCYTVSAATSTSAWPCVHAPPRTVVPAKVKSRWGKDEIQLSLALLSVRYFEKMDYRHRKK